MPRNPNTPCSVCGKLCWPSKKTSDKTWVPPEDHVCRDCRRAAPDNYRQASTGFIVTCGHCKQAFKAPWRGRKYCSRVCSNRAQSQPDTTVRENRRVLANRRAQRDREAPGMWTATKRKQLRDKWKRQGRLCIYCSEALATTVDHVVPLALGGTNHEGNLVPACFECNRLKQDNLLSAWRYGIRVHKWRTEVGPCAPRQPMIRLRKTAGQTALQSCVTCDALTTRPKHCSDECAIEWNRRLNRDRYRARVGLPVNPSEPTSKWVAYANASGF